MTRTTIIATAISALLAGAVQGAKPASSDKLAMDVALGLWEVTAAGDTSGAPPIPQAMLERMTPEQQQRLQAALAKHNQPQKYKQCMTADKLEQGFARSGAKGDAEDKCKTNVSTNTSSEYQAERQCTTQDDVSYDAKVHFNLSDKHTAKGTVDVVITQADGKTTTMHRTIDAQWLSADCGAVKDVQPETP